VTVHYRMGYVGTVGVPNKEGEVLVTRRYAVPAHDGPKEVLARMMADLDRALAENPKLHVGVVQDNAPEMWNLMREALESARLPPFWSHFASRYVANSEAA
jgi:hypothetical protein